MSNATFMDQALDIILSTPGHPLENLVNRKAKSWWGRTAHTKVMKGRPVVQAGHLQSRFSGGDRLAVQDAYSNWWESASERKSQIIEREAVSIGGVPVDRGSAEMWERTGIIPSGTVAKSPKVPGWVEGDRLTPPPSDELGPPKQIPSVDEELDAGARGSDLKDGTTSLPGGAEGQEMLSGTGTTGLLAPVFGLGAGFGFGGVATGGLLDWILSLLGVGTMNASGDRNSSDQTRSAPTSQDTSSPTAPSGHDAPSRPDTAPPQNNGSGSQASAEPEHDTASPTAQSLFGSAYGDASGVILAAPTSPGGDSSGGLPGISGGGALDVPTSGPDVSTGAGDISAPDADPGLSSGSVSVLSDPGASSLVPGAPLDQPTTIVSVLTSPSGAASCGIPGMSHNASVSTQATIVGTVSDPGISMSADSSTSSGTMIVDGSVSSSGPDAGSGDSSGGTPGNSGGGPIDHSLPGGAGTPPSGVDSSGGLGASLDQGTMPMFDPGPSIMPDAVIMPMMASFDIGSSFSMPDPTMGMGFDPSAGAIPFPDMSGSIPMSDPSMGMGPDLSAQLAASGPPPVFPTDTGAGGPPPG